MDLELSAPEKELAKRGREFCDQILILIDLIADEHGEVPMERRAAIRQAVRDWGLAGMNGVLLSIGGHRKASFGTLLWITSKGQPKTYWDITSSDNPHRERPPRLITPRRRKAAFGMREDDHP